LALNVIREAERHGIVSLSLLIGKAGYKKVFSTFFTSYPGS
jgi:hypothetical protein